MASAAACCRDVPGGAAGQGAHANGLWWLAVGDEFQGQTIERIDVAAGGAHPPVPPALTRIPRAGEFDASPALASLLKTTPAAELKDRFPGR